MSDFISSLTTSTSPSISSRLLCEFKCCCFNSKALAIVCLACSSFRSNSSSRGYNGKTICSNMYKKQYAVKCYKGTSQDWCWSIHCSSETTVFMLCQLNRKVSHVYEIIYNMNRLHGRVSWSKGLLFEWEKTSVCRCKSVWIPQHRQIYQPPLSYRLLLKIIGTLSCCFSPFLQRERTSVTSCMLPIHRQPSLKEFLF